ncbi:hypothetical protein CE161_05885 [Bifidobacterium longum]|uniref:FHA domain-containing protein n=1 Tax=Bifidobacterium longum TaxID=216816 RepID=UPI000E211034|nr:FHA domain-containing protein [Bifidobacterium longum]RDX17936.1 hypothetical protein CE161_05885 [Bifidobacterium longum]
MVAAAATSVVSHQERTITGYGAASAGKQCAASLIDVCCVALGTVVAMVLSRNPAVCVMIAVEMVLVFAVWEAVRGETPGKVVLGVRTVRVECQRDHRNGILPAGLSRAFVKYLVLLASSMVFGIGLLIMICSPMFSRSELRQGWADKIARLAEADIHKQVTAALPVQKLQFHTVSSSTMHESTTSGSALSVPAPEPAPAPVIPKTPVSPAVPSVPLSAPAPALAPVPIVRATPAAPLVPAVSTPSVPSAPTAKSMPLPVAQPSVRKVKHTALPSPAGNALPSRPGNVPPVPPKQITIYFEDGSREPLVIPSNVVLGRNPSPQQNGDVVLAVPDRTGTVSRNHVRLEITAGHMWITDLNSTNGTRVVNEDGEEIDLVAQQRHAIQSGARISLGDMGCSIIMAKSRGRRS